MKKKEKIIIVVAVVCMVATVLAGLTYAYWTVTKVQTGVNVVESDCFNIEFTEANDIELQHAIPILNEEGMRLTPYTFTIENTCSTFATYQINLETFDVESGKSRMKDSYVKANLQKGNGNKFSDILKSEYEVTPTITGATNAYKLATGTLKNGNVHTYNLRIWMDENITYEDTDSMNASFKSKISVIFTAAIDPFAESGTLKQAPSSSPYTEFWAYKDNITEVEFQNKMEPIAGAIESWDVSATTDGSVMAYMINNGTDAEPEYKVFIQGKGGVKANPNSSRLFLLFKKLQRILGLEYFDTSNITNGKSMFSSVGYDAETVELDLTGLDFSNITESSNMFASVGYNSNSVELNLTGLDFSNSTNMSGMFSHAFHRTQNINFNVKNLVSDKVTNMDEMFLNFGYNYRGEINLDLTGLNTSNVTNMSQMFVDFGYNASKIKIDLTSFNTANVTNMSSMFLYVGKNYATDVKILFGEKFVGTNVKNVSDMFRCFGYKSKELSIDLSNFKPKELTNMSRIFEEAGFNSQKVYININNFNTSNVTNMSNMFKRAAYYATDVQILGLESFDTSNVTNMKGAFTYLASATTQDINLDLSNWNTSKVTDMTAMFFGFGQHSNKLRINLSNFDTSNVILMGVESSNWTNGGMFENCGQYSNDFYLDISSFNTSNVEKFTGMFKNCGSGAQNFTINLSNLDFSKATDVSYMFYELGKQSQALNTTINFNNNDSSLIYDYIFTDAIQQSGSQIKVNYTSSNESTVEAMIATKTNSANIAKGTLIS